MFVCCCQANMMTLAEHIIEATPERIKRENFSAVESVPLDSSGLSNTMSWLATYLGDVEQLPSIIHLRWEASGGKTLSVQVLAHGMNLNINGPVVFLYCHRQNEQSTWIKWRCWTMSQWFCCLYVDFTFSTAEVHLIYQVQNAKLFYLFKPPTHIWTKNTYILI